MTEHSASLKWIESQHEKMIDQITSWASINSGTQNLRGLAEMLGILRRDFSILEAEETIVELKGFGNALLLKKRPNASKQVLLVGHMDTVFGEDHPFQSVERKGDQLNGPGVADMKGGLVVMLTALEAIEKTPFIDDLGWEVWITSDEEVGSPSSAPLLEEMAKRHQIGLIFEPSFPDGTIVSQRKGSANYTLTVKGVPAHAGRNFEEGKSAIYALSSTIHEIEKLIPIHPKTSVNVGMIKGGAAPNIVPKDASCLINVRSFSRDTLELVDKSLHQIVEKESLREGISLQLSNNTTRPAKPIDSQTKRMLQHLKMCGKEIGLPVSWKETGGCCDGNNLAAAGLPNIDTLGVVGGGLHTDQEYMKIDSAVERAKLVALFLLHYATGAWTFEDE